MPRYVILNDGETFTELKDCVIYESETNFLFTIRKNKYIDTGSDLKNMYWEKGISEIIESEREDREANTPLGILNKE